MTLTYLTIGFTLAALAGVYLPWTGWMIPAGLAALAVSLLLWKGRKRLLVSSVLLGVSLALLWLTVYGALFLSPARAMKDRTLRMEAVVIDWPEETRYGVSIPVRAGEEDGRKVRAIFYGDRSLSDLRPGDVISCVAYCQGADRIAGEESLYYTARGVHLLVKGYGEISVTPVEGIPPRYAMAYLAENIRGIIDRLYPERQAGFLCALLTGDKSGLGDVDQNNFKRVGLGHVVVISGLHVTFLMGFLSLFLKKRKVMFPVTVAVMVLFCLMTGSAPGTVRAVVLCTMTMFAPMVKRRYHNLTGLAAALLLLLAWNPYSIADAGLQFSFLSTLGIFQFGQKWSKKWVNKIPKKHRKRARPFVSVLAVSLGSMIFTVPLSALYFGQYSLIAPLSNVATHWAVSLAFLGGILSVLAGAILFPVGKLIALAVGLPVRFFLWFAAAASKLPLAAITVEDGYYALWTVFVYLVICLYLFVPVKGKRPIVPVCACVSTLCLSALLTAGTVQRADLTLTVLDVGQGQSIAAWARETCVLIDCGGTSDPGDAAATYLQSRGRSTLDLLVLTHFHDDHAAGVPELMGRVKVNALAVPDVDEDSPLRQEIERLAKEQGTKIYYITELSELDLDGAKFTLFPPMAAEGDSNEQCLAVLCSSGSWDALITGDMPIEAETQLVATGLLPDLEVLVAGHHGSKYSTGDVLLTLTRPETAVISVGYNSYGHPTPEVLERLDHIGAQIYRTDQNGAVTLYANGKEAE